MVQSIDKEKALIHLGIDFGTSFTKVCYRIRGRGYNQVKPAPFLVEKLPPGMLPSIVYEGFDGRLAGPLDRAASRNDTIYRYIKMRLTNLWTSSMGKESRVPPKVLAVFFLAELIRKAKAAIEVAERTRIEGKTVTWTAKICLPLGNNDRSLIDFFNQIYHYAWLLSENPIPREPHNLEAAITSAGHLTTIPRCRGYPELAAAVHSFLQSRDARPGLYCYFDIGGGTLDGAAFHLKQDAEGPRHIYIYKSSVTPHGMASICERAGILDDADIHSEETRLSIDKALIANDRLGKAEEEIRQVIASTLVSMRDLAREDNTWAYYYGEYRVYIGGGGSKSRWYKRVIESTIGRLSLNNELVKHFHLRDCTLPDELSLDAKWEYERNRYAVAHGLSTPLGEELPIHGFPWQYDSKLINSLANQSRQSGKKIQAVTAKKRQGPCICGGRNSDCEFCGGWGEIDAISVNRGATPGPSVQRSPHSSSIESPARKTKVRHVSTNKHATLDSNRPRSRKSNDEPKLLLKKNHKKKTSHEVDQKSISDRFFRFIYAALTNNNMYKHLKRCILCYAPLRPGKLLKHLEDKHADLVTAVKRRIESEPSPIPRRPIISKEPDKSIIMKPKVAEDVKVDIPTIHTPRVFTIKAKPASPKPSLASIEGLVNKLGLRYENNRNMGGGFWVYCNERAFDPLKHELDNLHIEYRHYPNGRKLRSGEQYEIDPGKHIR